MVSTTIWISPGTSFGFKLLGEDRDLRRSRFFGFGFSFVLVINNAGRPVDFLVLDFVTLFWYD
jgi:hypothetical protein